MSGKKKDTMTVSGVIGVALCIVFVPVIIVNLILIISSYTKPDEIPGVFGIRPVVVLSGSMEPAIMTGDLIFIHDTDAAGVREGDVICYLTSGQAVTHRVMSINTGEDGETRYITRGDANNTEDRLPVTGEQIQGVWKGGRIEKLGNFILFMQTTTGMILFIICPLLLFFIWDIWRRHRLDKEEAAHTAQLEAELAALKTGKGPEGRTAQEEK